MLPLSFLIDDVVHYMTEFKSYMSCKSIYNIIEDECKTIDVMSRESYNSFVRYELILSISKRCEHLIWNINIIVNEVNNIVISKRVIRKWMEICFRPPKFFNNYDEGGYLYHYTNKNRLIDWTTD
jgi:hypothetical protein